MIHGLERRLKVDLKEVLRSVIGPRLTQKYATMIKRVRSRLEPELNSLKTFRL